MFVDRARVFVYAGDGGNGCASFRREKYVPRGGPDGGDGGPGGSVIFRVAEGEQSLVNLKFRQHWKAGRGTHGMGKDRHGHRGEDCIVDVPPGTIVWDDETDELLVDLTEPGQEFVVAEGGRGGRGNCRFVSSLNRAPTKYTEGKPGQKRVLRAVMKTIADVGLVGYPNAGKSTLVTAISDAHPKTAPYPFTTLHPNVGVVEFDDFFRYTVADIPGLIDGAHDNVGLGHDFLRHIERCHILAYVLDMGATDGRDPLEDLRHLRAELEMYQEGLTERPTILVANKMDMDEAEENLARLREAEPYPIIPVIAEIEENTGEVIKILRKIVEKARKEAAEKKRREQEANEPPPPVLSPPEMYAETDDDPDE
jgi:GTP-binding protein